MIDDQERFRILNAAHDLSVKLGRELSGQELLQFYAETTGNTVEEVSLVKSLDELHSIGDVTAHFFNDSQNIPRVQGIRISPEGIKFIQEFQSKIADEGRGVWAWLTGPKYGLVTVIVLFLGSVVVPLYIHVTPREKTHIVQVLQPQEEALLGIIHKYQVRLSAVKLIIMRDGSLHLDNSQESKKTNLAKELLGTEGDKTDRNAEFERLMQEIPQEYLRMFPETRYGNPFVVSITEEGIRYLKAR